MSDPASSGGGALYAVALDGDDRVVYELPPGGIEGGCYRGAAVVVADRFEDFLGQIKQRLGEALS